MAIIADKLRLMELTQNGFDGEEENQALVIQAADRIEELERVLIIIASEGEGRFRWSMTQAEALARKVIANG